MQDRRRFRVELERPMDHNVAVVVLAGEVDLYTAPPFKDVLLQAIDDGTPHIVVDLSAVTFIDSTGLGVLIAGAKQLRSPIGSLALVCPDARIRRILEITGLDGIFAIFRTREEALGR